MSEHTHWDELAAGYALDALEPADHAEFVAHLATCERCRSSVSEHALIAAQLGSIPGDDADLSPPPWSAIRPAIVGASPAPPPVADLAGVRQRRRFAVLSAAAAVAVVIAGVVTWRVTTSGPNPIGSVAACRATTDCHVVALQASGAVRAHVLVHGRDVALLPTAMSAPPAGSVWALWQVPRGGAPRLLSEFASGSLHTRLAVPFGATSAFAVSQERAGTTPVTPTTVVATGAVA